MTLTVLPVVGMPEVRAGDVLAELVAERAELADGDVVVVTQKVVSKAEGRLVDLDPSDLAARASLVEAESVRVLRRRADLAVVETRHGFVCANAGVDLSNVPLGQAALLPVDPDRSARRIRDGLRARAGVDVAVVVSDSFGRPWRRGVTDVAIGVAGMDPVADYRGERDPYGYPMEASVLAVADELAAAAELVMGKTAGIPLAVVRGYPYAPTLGTGKDLLMPPERDMFR